MWKKYDHPILGPVVYTIDEHQFFQGGYTLRDVDEARREDGTPLTVDEKLQLNADLKQAGLL